MLEHTLLHVATDPVKMEEAKVRPGPPVVSSSTSTWSSFGVNDHNVVRNYCTMTE